MNTLQAGDATVEVSPEHGGRVAQINVRGTDLLVSREQFDAPMAWGSYPMVPWAGRIRNGRFLFQGRWYELPITMGDHAIHGTGYLDQWTVLDEGRDHVEMQCSLDWVFGGTAHQHIQLTPVALVCVLSVLAADRAMPATIGWHPWFRTPARDRLQFEQMYLRDDAYIPSGELVPPPARPWDDCFIGAHHPLQLVYPDGPTVTVSSDCDHWVVFDQLSHATCVEPQSGPPDAVNLGLASILAPGELLQRTMTIAWTDGGRPARAG